RFRHLLVLELAERLVLPGDRIEDFENLGLQLRFHSGERNAEIVALVVVFLLDHRLVEILWAQHVAILVIAAGGLRPAVLRPPGPCRANTCAPARLCGRPALWRPRP